MSAPTLAVRPVSATLTLSPAVWLALGLALQVAVGMRYSLAPLAWIAPVPMLLFLRQTDGWRSRGLFVAGMTLAAVLQVAKIVTDPVPWVLALGFGAPSGFGVGLIYIAFEAVRRRVGDAWGLALVPAVVITADWLGYAASSSGVWGSLANTQLDALPLLQVVSLVGITGVSGLMAAVAAVLAVTVATGRLPVRAAGATAALLVLVSAFGTWRLDSADDGPTVRVAGVVTDLVLAGSRMPSDAELAEGTDVLFERSHDAVNQGAELVVWNEGATAVWPDQEDGLVARGAAFAAETGADLVLAYIVIEHTDPLQFANRLVVVGPEGPVQTYDKREPAPGEPSAGSAVAFQPVQRPWGILGAAICYDFDFPAIGRSNAGAGVVAVPSSDWRGIDPLHGRMASVRAIESGYAMIRPVRWATTLATDAHGRVRGAATWSSGDRILVADVPVTPVPTVYASIGDVLPGSALGVVLWVLVLAARRRDTSASPSGWLFTHR
ncbi:MAG: apolipoprotein N-acyltransferase [Myxococcota bacterium]|jgi:apolipoprotein N-acyltransferase